MSHILKRFIDILESVNFKNIIGALFILFVIVQIVRFSQSWNQRREVFYEHFNFLKTLASSQVASVQIDDQCEFPANTINEFVTAINQVKEFEPDHHIGEPFGILRITLTSGAVHTYLLLYHEKDGPLIEFYKSLPSNNAEAFSQPGIGSFGSYETYGMAESALLPQVLTKVCGRAQPQL